MLVGDSGVGKTCLLVRFKDGAFLAGSFISTVGIDFRNRGRAELLCLLWDEGEGAARTHSAASPRHTVPPWGWLLSVLTWEPWAEAPRSRRHLMAVGTLGFRHFKPSAALASHPRKGSAPCLNKVLTVDGVKVKLQIWDTAGQERFRSVTHAYYRDAHALLLLYDVTNKASFDNIQAWLTEIHEYAQQDVVLMLLGNKVDSAQDRVVKREDGEKLAKEYGVPFMETSAKSGLNVELAFTAIAKELKHRSMKLPNEPKFKLHDYVKKEVRGSGCCRS
ncbi:ras-related protein Rab-26 isoform X1 [Pipra filicauda]|uniref:small monomeric GTPase n=1 Tax=Pipra filicauda TaxID=649802 RepID=A0A7R5KCX6_9PASS|nr:ras-related protein Rab-26 isoform X1 [Pipra filicauda]